MYTHHNGEIAQAESLTKKPFVRYWLHNAFITVNDDRMAKSQGTGIRLADLVEKGFSPSDYRYWLLQSHYRTLANFTFDALEGAHVALTKLKRFVYEELGEQRIGRVAAKYERRFLTALADDLDTPKALAIIWELVKDTRVSPADKLATIHVFDSLLSLGLAKTPEEGRKELGLLNDSDIPEHVRALVAARSEARSQKNWPEADRLRDALATEGYEVKDTDEGPALTRR